MAEINLLMEKLRDGNIQNSELKVLDDLLYATIRRYWHEHITGNRSVKAVEYLDKLEQEFLELKVNFLINNI